MNFKKSNLKFYCLLYWARWSIGQLWMNKHLNNFAEAKCNLIQLFDQRTCYALTTTREYIIAMHDWKIKFVVCVRSFVRSFVCYAFSIKWNYLSKKICLAIRFQYICYFVVHTVFIFTIVAYVYNIYSMKKNMCLCTIYNDDGGVAVLSVAVAVLFYS